MSLDRVTSNLRHWLRSIVCSLGLLLVSQLALAAQPCVDHAGAEATVSSAGWMAGCSDMAGAVDACVAKSEQSEAAATPYASGDSQSLAVPPIAGAYIAAFESGTVVVPGPAPGHSSPVHIRLRRFLS